MTFEPDPTADGVGSAAHKLDRLQAQVTSMRAVLISLLQDVVQTQSRMSADQSAQLLEVNEELVLAALTAQQLRESADLGEWRGPVIPVGIASLPGLSLTRRVLDLSLLVHQVVGALRPSIDASRQRLGVHIAPGSVAVDADAVRLTQVVATLLGNASKHTPDEGQIELRLAVSDDGVRLTVSDSGSGLPVDALRSLFDAPVRAAHGADNCGHGLGIQLDMARRIIEAHGGTLSAGSDGNNHGSRLTVTLPIAEPAAHQ